MTGIINGNVQRVADSVWLLAANRLLIPVVAFLVAVMVSLSGWALIEIIALGKQVTAIESKQPGVDAGQDRQLEEIKRLVVGLYRVVDADKDFQLRDQRLDANERRLDEHDAAIERLENRPLFGPGGSNK